MPDGSSALSAALPAVQNDSDVLYLTFDYMDTLKNLGSGVVQIGCRTAKVSRSKVGPQTARELGLRPLEALSEPEWEGASDFILKQHYITKFGVLWVLLRNLFFGEDERLALPAAWKEQLISTALSRTHLSPDVVAKALEPMRRDRLRELGVQTILATGVSHGAALVQGFHLFYSRAARYVEAMGSGSSSLPLHSLHFGAYRWTDVNGRNIFRELTGCTQVAAPQNDPGVYPSAAASPRRSHEGSMVLGSLGDAVAVSLQDPKQKHVVDPVPRIDWRWGLFFCRRGYVSVVEPIGLVVGSGDVVELQARARQQRRLFFTAAPFRTKYHMANNYRNATGKLTSAFQSKNEVRRREKTRDGTAHAKTRWGDAKKGVKQLFSSLKSPSPRRASDGSTADAATPAAAAAPQVPQEDTPGASAS